jgi:hypothetical protein
MSYRYDLLYLPEIKDDSYVLVTSMGESVAVRIYTSENESPIRIDGRNLQSLAELHGQAAKTGCEILDRLKERTVTDHSYWFRRIQRANKSLAVRVATGALPSGGAFPSTTAGCFHPTTSDALDSGARPGGFQDNLGRTLFTLDDWSGAHPAEHWKSGYSAMELARTWRHADGIPPKVAGMLERGGLGPLEMVRGIVECKTAVPGAGNPSQTDLMVEAVDPSGAMVVLGVEGKVSESFGPLVKTWLKDVDHERSRENKEERLAGLLTALELRRAAPEVGWVRYQLIHRTFAALAHARELGAHRAVLVVHSFAPGADASNRRAYFEFLEALGIGDADVEAPVRVGERMGVELWACWVRDQPLPRMQDTRR